MSIAQMLLAEIEQEAIATRKCLERLPADRLDWKPADKSMSAGQLAFHIASAPGGIIQMLSQPEIDLPGFGEPPSASREEILAAFEASLATQRELLAQWDDAFLLAEWRVLKDGRELMRIPRVGFARMVLLSHIYHHRGQLSVYLRMLGVAVPSIYGPSADELPPFLTEAAG